MIRLRHEWRRLSVAVIGIALGAFAISQTSGMSELGRVFPITASLVAIGAGLSLFLQTVLRPNSNVEVGERVDYVRAGLLAFTLVAWALALATIGFVASSSIAVVSVAAIARRAPMSIRSIVFHAVAGTLLVLGFSLLMSEVLNVRLP